MLAVAGIALVSGQADAQAPSVIVSPQIEIFAGPGDQGRGGVSISFDSAHNRFLVLWTDEVSTPSDVYGQLVNADGTRYGSPIAITVNEGWQWSPQATFDPVNERYLAVWDDNRNGVSNIYGQLVSADGSLYGSNFAISPLPPSDHQGWRPKVRFDSGNDRFFVIWSGPSTGLPYNLYGQFVNADGSLHGSMIQLTDVGTEYFLSWQDMQSDPSNSRFLVTWVNQYDAHIYGQLLNADATPYGSEIAVGQYGLGWSFTGSLGFDPVHSGFLEAWDGPSGGIVGQLIDADGTLYGTEFTILSESETYPPSVAFDDANKRFLVASGIQLSYLGITGQFLNPDGSLYGSNFEVFRVSSTPYMGGYWPLVASGSAQTGSLVVWRDVPYEGLGYSADIFGKFVKLGGPAVGGIAELPAVSASSGPPYAALAGGLAAAALALTAGGWYARRRWLR